MKKFCRCFTAMLTMALLLSVFPVTAYAKPYTYTVTFYAGNHGTFNSSQDIRLDKIAGSAATVNPPSEDGNRIVVEKLMCGDRISFNVPEKAVTLNNSKYYVKGIRRSGTEIEEASFEVDKDMDYVVAYGIKGNMVGYTVNYEDEAGNTLAPSRTYYGNVGDKPVVAYTYVEGYTPEAYAMTKTLSSNEQENVFTFVYREGEIQIIETPGETITTIITEPAEGTGTGTGTAGTGTGTGTGATGAGAGAAGAGAGTAGEGTGAAGEDAEAAEGTTVGDTDDETTTVEDEEVPQDLVDLDDEEAPKANIKLDKEEVKKGFPMAAGIAVSVAAVAALVGMIIFLKRHRH